MTLLQRDRENIELGREQGLEQGYQQATPWTTDILKLYVKGVPTDIIASRLQLDMDYIAQVIHNFEAE